MKNVVAYCRVSTDAQAGENKYGIEAQKQQIMQYCAGHDMQISKWFVDEGESGVKENRPQLDALLFGDIHNPPVEAVIVAKSDRIARDIKLYYYFMMLFEKRGMKLISATEEVVNDDTGLGNVYRSLMLFVAEQERKNITRRTSGGRAIKSAGGGYSGGRPAYGYRAENGSLAIIEDEAETVRMIFSLKEQGFTYRDICAELEKVGRRTRTGTKFTAGVLGGFFKNEPLYRGMYRYGANKEWVPGQHEAILKDE